MPRKPYRPKVALFVADILDVYARHRMSLGHSNDRGQFLIEDLSPINVKWLHDATDMTTRKTGGRVRKEPHQ